MSRGTALRTTPVPLQRYSLDRAATGFGPSEYTYRDGSPISNYAQDPRTRNSNSGYSTSIVSDPEEVALIYRAIPAIPKRHTRPIVVRSKRTPTITQQRPSRNSALPPAATGKFVDLA